MARAYARLNFEKADYLMRRAQQRRNGHYALLDRPFAATNCPIFSAHCATDLEDGIGFAGSQCVALRCHAKRATVIYFSITGNTRGPVVLKLALTLFLNHSCWPSHPRPAPSHPRVSPRGDYYAFEKSKLNLPLIKLSYQSSRRTIVFFSVKSFGR